MAFRTRFLSLACCSFAFGATFASAANFRDERVISLEAADTVISSAEKLAQSSGWPCVIAVVDRSGMIVSMKRMDGASVPAGVFLAPGKARTAALFKRPTSVLEDAINGPRPAAITAGDFVMMRGGVPLIQDGEVIGAVGVSSDTPAHDQAIADAGAAALSEKQ